MMKLRSLLEVGRSWVQHVELSQGQDGPAALTEPASPPPGAKALTEGPTTAPDPSGFVAERMVDTCARLFDAASAILERGPEPKWSVRDLERGTIAIEKCAHQLWATRGTSTGDVDLTELRTSYERFEALLGSETASRWRDPRIEQVRSLTERLGEGPPEELNRRQSLAARIERALASIDSSAAFLGHPELLAGFNLEQLRQLAKGVPPPPVDGHPFTTSWAGPWARAEYFSRRYPWLFSPLRTHAAEVAPVAVPRLLEAAIPHLEDLQRLRSVNVTGTELDRPIREAADQLYLRMKQNGPE